MIVVEVGVKNLWLPLRIKNIKLVHTGVKLGSKQLKIFGFKIVNLKKIYIKLFSLHFSPKK
jgi:hypothetical protein